MNIVQQKQHCHQNRNISWQLHYNVIQCKRIKNLVCELLALVSMIIRQNLKDSTKSFGWVFFAIVCLLVCLLRLFVQMYVCVHILFVCFVMQSDETFVSLIKVYEIMASYCLSQFDKFKLVTIRPHLSMAMFGGRYSNDILQSRSNVLCYNSIAVVTIMHIMPLLMEVFVTPKLFFFQRKLCDHFQQRISI